MKKYCYFISYHFIQGKCKDELIGFGNIGVASNKKINSIDVVREIEEHIKEKNGFHWIAIANWKLLRVTKDEEAQV